MDIQLNILKFFQQLKSPIFDILFLVLTISTEVPVVILFTAYMYWCRDKYKSQRILLSLVGNITINTGIKEFVKAPRPIGIEGIDSMRESTATGYSFPSGHTQTATSFWLSIIYLYRNQKILIIGCIMFIGVGISRLYLGVHWPIDVIFGWIFGIVFTLIFLKIFDYIDNTKRYEVLLYLLIPFIGFVFIVNSAKYVEILGLLIGFVIGYIVEDKYIRFETSSTTKNRINFNSKKRLNKNNIYRFLIGILTLGAVYVVLKFIMPDSEILNSIRYGLIAFYGVAGVPFIFKISKLD